MKAAMLHPDLFVFSWGVESSDVVILVFPAQLALILLFVFVRARNLREKTNFQQLA
jgi:hypothetical protein